VPLYGIIFLDKIIVVVFVPGKEKEAKEHFRAAQELIDATGYHRRDMAHEFPRISTNF
jgi:hypothetical protein